MRTLVVTILGLIGGLFVGFVLSQVVGMGAFLLFGGIEFLAPIRYLPFVTASLGAAVALVLDMRIRRGSS